MFMWPVGPRFPNSLSTMGANKYASEKIVISVHVLRKNVKTVILKTFETYSILIGLQPFFFFF